MRVDAGEHGILESPERLIDPQSGEVCLRLWRTHLQRMHAPELRGSYVPCGGDPDSPFTFPLLKGSQPVEVTLRGGMSLLEVSAGIEFEPATTEWTGQVGWRWIAAALTPWGWDQHPIATFNIGEIRLLRALDLSPSCFAPPDAFSQADALLTHELGDPHYAQNQPMTRKWWYQWGEVRLGQAFDGSGAQVVVEW